MNRDFGRIEGGVFSYAPSSVTVNGQVVMNPTLVDYVKAGYYPCEDNPPTSTVDDIYSPTGWSYDDDSAPTKCIRSYALDTASNAPSSALAQALTGLSVSSMTGDQKDATLQIAAEVIRKEHS